MDPLIINVALTGCVAQKADNPALPITPEEVAADARLCAGEGATVFHIHARDSQGNPVWGKSVYQTYIDAVRDAVPGAVVCASLSGRHVTEFGKRAAPLAARPDLASLTLGSVDFQDGHTSVNSTSTVRGLLKLMEYWKVKPEFEAFDLGHCFRLQELAKSGNLSKPIYMNMIFGVNLPWDPAIARAMLPYLPGEILLSITAVGQGACTANRWAIRRGGHVRVGLEDSLWMAKGDRATNQRLVERAVKFARSQGREPATVDQAREMLGLEVGE